MILYSDKIGPFELDVLNSLSWETLVEVGLSKMLDAAVLHEVISDAHVKDTPIRYTKAMDEIFDGINKNPEDALNTLFPVDNCEEMVHVKEITFFSTCAHHLIPFFGKMSFAYIPDKHIVGLSKIPRLVDVYARRPQVQEKLTTDIVDAFQRIVQPKGCALMIRGYHMCMMARGIKQPTSYTETTALRGVFKDNPSTKAEWLMSANAENWRVF